MFVSNEMRSMDHATLDFKLNGIMKKTNQTKGLWSVVAIEIKQQGIAKYESDCILDFTIEIVIFWPWK